MNIQGKVVRVLPTQTVGEKGFQKREIHVEIDADSKYPQIIGLEAHGDKTSLLDGINPGDVVSFDINLRGREWTNKDGAIVVFNTLAIWKVEVKVKANVTEQSNPQLDENQDPPF